MRYILREAERPLAGDYYYEATKTTNDHFRIYRLTRTIFMKFISSAPVL